MKDRFGYDPHLIITLVECTCRDGHGYAMDAQPEWFKDHDMAVRRALEHKANRDLYWGVHFKGQHMLVKIPKQINE